MKVCEVRSKIYVAINAWHYTGWAMSDSHSSTGSQRLHTDGVGPVECLGKRHSQTHTHTQFNTDQRSVVHQQCKRENYGLLWSGVSKVKEWRSIIWAAKLWHRLIRLLLDACPFRKPVFHDFIFQKEWKKGPFKLHLSYIFYITFQTIGVLELFTVF